MTCWSLIQKNYPSLFRKRTSELINALLARPETFYAISSCESFRCFYQTIAMIDCRPVSYGWVNTSDAIVDMHQPSQHRFILSKASI